MTAAPAITIASTRNRRDALACVGYAQQVYDTGERTVQQIADLFSVPRTTVYGYLDDASKDKRPAAQGTPNSPAVVAAS